MFKQKTFLASCAFCLFGFVALGVNPVLAIQIQEKEIAQGDGDPMEVSAEERLMAAKQLADEEKATPKEEEMATVTAEGDFVLPTYLLPVADDSQKNAESVSSVSDEEDSEPVQEIQKPKNLQTQTFVKTKTTRELPVVMIKQTELIPVAEQMEVERRLTGSTAQTQKIYNDALARQQGAKQASSSARPSKTVTSLQKQGKSVSTDLEIEDILADTDESANTSTNKKTLLLPLKPQATTVKAESGDLTAKPIRKTFPSAFADKVLSAAKTDTSLPLIMPQDLKVSFYPNATDFSGQTIKWIKAFSLRALQDPRYVVEVRLSRQNPALQQKRFYVIQRILSSTGLSSHQIAVDYVDRPADSLILRTVKKAENTSIVKTKTGSGRSKEKSTINW